MLRRFQADLHIHTCLSPCGDLQMSPQKIVARILQLGIEIVAICDHNSTENIHPVMKAAEGRKVVVLPGMEICSSEEIHVLAIFGDLDSAFGLQALVYDRLPGTNDHKAFGLQVVANEFDEVVGFQDKLLIGATELTVEQVVDEIHQRGGLAIASHIDRETFSVIGQLGFVPESVEFDALELSGDIGYDEALAKFCKYKAYTFVRNSDAHFIADVGRKVSEFMLEQPSFLEIAKALRRENGRSVLTT